ncbi:patatin [Aureibaculum marinum]|uniref:Patatin n=1 Tax=Aureibaculum marinum TaxID=2487930 RepID=A0A3N4P168_9FLAO|nr:patatin-like phospholipase family protein [Aureibaculum marinum]RPD98736.1 patatin [Aureibaculum marinum]
MNFKQPKPVKIGLALSGGGVRGIAHVGVIKALEEYGISPDYIAGTSAGALVGALYAKGCSIEQIMHFFKTVNVFSINKFAWKKPGLVDTQKFYDEFLNILEEDTFDVLKKSLFITATNILDGTLKVFKEGDLIKPILASAAFPGVFTPIKIDDEYYIDGGTINNFPVDLLTPYCKRIIGVYVNPFKRIKIENLKNTFTVLDRAFKINMANDSLLKFSDCDLLICPDDLKSFGTFSFSDIDNVFNLGYEATLEVLESNSGRLLLADL